MSITPTLKLGGNARQLLNVQTLAAAGSALTDGTHITTRSPALIDVSAANGTKGIVLPKAVKGKMFFIKNGDSDNAVLKVYPYDASTQINAVTAGSAISMAAKTAAVFVCASATKWYTFSLLPS